MRYVPELFIDIAHAMGFTEVAEDKAKAVDCAALLHYDSETQLEVLKSIKELNKKLGIPANIKDSKLFSFK